MALVGDIVFVMGKFVVRGSEGLQEIPSSPTGKPSLGKLKLGEVKFGRFFCVFS